MPKSSPAFTAETFANPRLRAMLPASDPLAAAASVAKPSLPTTPCIAETKEERAIHTLICQELNRREIPYIHASMSKRSTLPVGWPDFTIFMKTAAWFAEIKTETGKLSKEQVECIGQLKDRGFHVCTPRSFQEFLTELNRL